MTRFTSKGHANPWSVPSPHRCHDRNIYGELQPMDYDNSISGLWWLFAAICLAPFVAALVMA